MPFKPRNAAKIPKVLGVAYDELGAISCEGVALSLCPIENNLPTVPPKLLFAYGNARTTTYEPLNRRNPGTKRYQFPVLSNSSPKHTENNFRGNWLLKEVLETCNSKFNVLHSSIQLRALESALFMIGYEVVAAG